MSQPIRLILAILLVALAACSTVLVVATPTLTAGLRLAYNRQKWDAQHITHYRIALSVDCLCAFSDKMPMTVEIDVMLP